MSSVVAKIRCKYSCAPCGLVDVEVDIPARREELDVVEWLERVLGHALAADHATRSPKCQAQKMERLMIPMPEGTAYVGQAKVVQ